MFRIIRLIFALVLARYRPKLGISDESITSFRVWFTDVDASIMNHSPIMTVLEAGRIDFMVRTGFFAIAMKRKWYFPLASLHTHFLRPLKLLQKAIVKTKVIYIDDLWIYMEQTIERDGKPLVHAIVQSVVKKGRERVSYKEISSTLSLGNVPEVKPEIISTIEDEKRVFDRQLA